MSVLAEFFTPVFIWLELALAHEWVYALRKSAIRRRTHICAPFEVQGYRGEDGAKSFLTDAVGKHRIAAEDWLWIVFCGVYKTMAKSAIFSAGPTWHGSERACMLLSRVARVVVSWLEGVDAAHRREHCRGCIPRYNEIVSYYAMQRESNVGSLFSTELSSSQGNFVKWRNSSRTRRDTWAFHHGSGRYGIGEYLEDTPVEESGSLS